MVIFERRVHVFLILPCLSLRLSPLSPDDVRSFRRLKPRTMTGGRGGGLSRPALGALVAGNRWLCAGGRFHNLTLDGDVDASRKLC